MSADECNTLVLGMGNELLSDDGIGPRLTRQLASSLNSQKIKFETAFVGGLDILEIIKGFKNVIFIDAIKTINGVPGTVYELGLDDFKETLHLSSFHDVSFLTAIELGKKLELELPENIKIIAIEIKEDLVFDDKLTPELEDKYEAVFEEVKGVFISLFY